MSASIVQLDYLARAPFESFHSRNNRWACLICHRRAGKTLACVYELVARALYTPKKNARYAYIAPFFRQAKDVAWQYLKEATQGIAAKTRESTLRIELPNGAWITLYGADNPDALRGLYLDGVVLDEFGDCRPSLWAEVVLPTLADRVGWAVFIGTPKGKNHFWAIRELARQSSDWFYLELKASESGILRASELEQMRAQMSEDQYKQEMECSFEASIVGAYYASLIEQLEINNQICPNTPQYDPEHLVYGVGDLGYTDSSSWWFWQSRPGGFAIIDYYEAHGQPLEHYAHVFQTKGYKLEELWLPHDARAKTLQTGRSTIEQMIDYGFPCRIVPKLAVQHGIDAVRKVLPACYINQTTCEDGIEALRAYRRRYDEITRSFSNQPKHDWSSHGADAFRYLSLVVREQLQEVSQEHTLQPLISPPEYKLAELFQEREQESGRIYSFSRRRIR